MYSSTHVSYLSNVVHFDAMLFIAKANSDCKCFSPRFRVNLSNLITWKITYMIVLWVKWKHSFCLVLVWHVVLSLKCQLMAFERAKNASTLFSFMERYLFCSDKKNYLRSRIIFFFVVVALFCFDKRSNRVPLKTNNIQRSVWFCFAATTQCFLYNHHDWIGQPVEILKI